MMRMCALASGSNGNCYYIDDDKDAVLIDVGISCKQVFLRMQNLKLDISKVKGIFVTHEHSDHTKGIEVLAGRFGIPVYITNKTMKNSGLRIDHDLVKSINIAKEEKIGKIRLLSFEKNHDAADPCSFVISCDGKKIGVMTDIGVKCKNVVKYLEQCDAIFLESNYDELMLEKGPYPYYLKQRISGDYGHLSNYQAALLCLEHANSKLKHVFLSHLSENNNDPDLCMQTFTGFLKERKDLKIKAHMTSRYEESCLLKLG